MSGHVAARRTRIRGHVGQHLALRRERPQRSRVLLQTIDGHLAARTSAQRQQRDHTNQPKRHNALTTRIVFKANDATEFRPAFPASGWPRMPQPLFSGSRWVRTSMCGCDRLKLAADHTRKHATRSDSERHGSRVAGPRRLPKARMTSIIDLCYPGKVEADVPGSDCNLSLNCLGRNITCLFNQSTLEPDRYATRAPLNVQLELHAPRIPADLVAETTMCSRYTRLPYGSANR